MTLSSKIARNIKATFISRAVTIGANGLLIVLLTRYLLDPGGYGLLSLALSTIAMAQLFADLGVARSAARYVAEFKELDSSQIPHIIRSALHYRILLIALVSTGLFFGHELVAAVLDEPGLEYLLLIGIGYLVFQSLMTFNLALFQGFNAIEYSAALSIVNNLCRIGFVVVFVILGFEVAGVLAGYAVSAAVATVIGLGILYARFYRTYDSANTPEPGLRRRIAEYSIPLTASRSANVIDKRIDVLLIGYFLAPAAVGFYTLAKQLTEFITAPAGSVGFALSPTYGEDKANDRLERAARIYETTVQYVLLLYIPAVVGLLLVAEPMVFHIFGEKYSRVVPVIQILSVFVLFQAITNVTTQALDYLGRARYRAISKGVTSLANFGLNIVLIPAFGVAGAAIATVITYGMYTIANVYIMYIELPLHLGRLRRVITGTVVVSAVMGGCVVVLTPHISGVLSLIGVVILGTVVWGLLMIASGLLDAKETISFLT